MKTLAPDLPPPIPASHGDVIALLGVAPSEAPLSHLVAAADTDGMRELLATNDVGGEDLRNALILACTTFKTEPLQVLIAHRVDVNARTLDGKLAIYNAASRRYMDKVRMLLDAGADPNATIHSRPLLQSLCLAAENYAVVALLIERGADVHATDEKGSQALHVAAGQWLPHLTATLLSAGADPNAKDEEGRTPIEIAVDQGQTENLKLLLAAGAEVPQILEADSYWDQLQEALEEDLVAGGQETAASKTSELRRIIRSAVLARDLSAAMSDDDPAPAPRRASGPSPL